MFLPSKTIKPTSSAAGAAALTGTPLTNEIEARKAAEKMRVNFILRLGLWSGCLFFKVLYVCKRSHTASPICVKSTHKMKGMVCGNRVWHAQNKSIFHCFTERFTDRDDQNAHMHCQACCATGRIISSRGLRVCDNKTCPLR